MGDVEDMLGELEDEEDPKARPPPKKKLFKNRDDLELDLDAAWQGAKGEE